jgi:FKBP-type peptidyl-prolyl cis-trans isomerase FkpA
MSRNLKLFSFIILSFILISSCSGKYPGFEEADNGTYYKIHFQGNDSIKPKKGDWVTVLMDYGLKDSSFFTNSMLNEPLKFPMLDPMFKGDLYAGLSLMGSGDSMSFVVVVDSFFFKTAREKHLPPGIKTGSLMYYNVKLLNHISNDEHIAEKEKEKETLRQKEIEILNEYIADQKFTELPLESGLYFIPLNKSSGRLADTGEMCQIYIKVSTLNGKILYDNFNKEPMDVELGKKFDTEGLMEGISLLHLGEKAKLIVPSSIGVGELGW